MPIPNEYRDICEMLLEATNEGRVAWTEKSGTLIVRLPEFNLELWSGTDDRDQTDFVAVGLKDPRGQRLIDNWYVQEGDKDFEMLRILNGSALRQVRRISEKLDTLREMLRSGNKVGVEDDDVPL
jgi:hypothetical protein